MELPPDLKKTNTRMFCALLGQATHFSMDGNTGIGIGKSTYRHVTQDGYEPAYVLTIG